MNREFIEALHHVALERGVATEVLVQAFEDSLAQAYQKQKGYPAKAAKEGLGPSVEVHLDPQRGTLEVLEIKKVVTEVENPSREISIEEAQEFDPDVQVGEELEFPVDPEEFSQSAMRTARDLLTQKLKDAESERVFQEYQAHKGEVLTGVVTRTDNRGNVFVDLGRGEAQMPPRNQIPRENLFSGQRIKVYLEDVQNRAKGPSLTVSRAHPELLKYLLRQEVPEIAEGVVEIKAVAREPGARSKVAVTSKNPNVDPIGACIGHRGQRIQAVSQELGRERVDIIQWSSNPREFIRNALSPAEVGNIEIKGENRAIITVNKDQHSLAIGKGGQNVRLASHLTGYEIDFVESSGEIPELAETLELAARSEATPVSQEARARFEELFKESEGE